MKLTTQEILKLKMKPNDSGAKTVGGYLASLLTTVLEEQEGFSGKRPWGNSGWEYDLYEPLIKAGLVKGTFDEDGYLDRFNNNEMLKADKIILKLVKDVFK